MLPRSVGAGGYLQPLGGRSAMIVPTATVVRSLWSRVRNEVPETTGLSLICCCPAPPAGQLTENETFQEIN